MENKQDITTLLEVFQRMSKMSNEDILNLQFVSDVEAYQFYCDYARWKGFAVRKDDVERDCNGKIKMRQLVCSREGVREGKYFNRVDRCREEKPITRSKCPAKLRVSLNVDTGKWRVVSFIEKHNHDLTPSELVHLIPCHRKLSESDKAQVDSLYVHGVKTSHILGLMVGQKGGHSSLGFCPKDLHNYLDKEKRARIDDGDAFAALSYIQAKADNDPYFFCKFTTADGRLEHLFWADGGSILDYQCFGDVVAFDTTYKKNKYNRPLVIFCGYNHHGQTTIFACALVADEKTETYIWVLQAFLQAMSHKYPIGLVTDSDGAMKEAIRVVFPNALHRLCGWHIQQNACENVKDSNFLTDFKYLIYNNITEEVFEDEWKKIVDKYELRKNAWMMKMYKMKRLWAMAYMRDKFFAGIRTTSICEGINSFIKTYVQRKNTLVDLIHNLERAIKKYRHNEIEQDFKSMYGEPVLTTGLEKYESAAAKFYTRKKFKEVRKEIVGVAAVNVIDRLDCGDIVQFRLNNFCHPHVEFVVLVDKSKSKFECVCRMFESQGIPCCHIFAAMTHLHVDVLPPTLICKRWTKSAKKDYMSAIPLNVKDSEKVYMLRKGALAAACNRLCDLGGKTFEDYEKVSEEIYKIVGMLEKKQDPNWKPTNNPDVVGDPTVVKTKGAPRKRTKKYTKKRRCSNCRKSGHFRKTCPELVKKDVLHSVTVDETEYQSEDESSEKVGEAKVAGEKRKCSESKDFRCDKKNVNSKIDNNVEANEQSESHGVKARVQTNVVSEDVLVENHLKKVNPAHFTNVVTNDGVGVQNNMFFHNPYGQYDSSSIGSNDKFMRNGGFGTSQSYTALLNQLHSFPTMSQYGGFPPYGINLSTQYPHMHQDGQQ